MPQQQTASSLLQETARDCDYDPDGEGGLEDLIAYKEALEDEIRRLFPKAEAWDRMSGALDRNAAAWERRHDGAHDPATAADVCAIGFALQKDLKDGNPPGTTWA